MNNIKSNELGETLSLYSGLGKSAWEKLANLDIKTLELKKNQKLYTALEGRVDVYWIKEGWASLSHSADRRGQDIYNLFTPGDLVGMRESYFVNQDIVLIALTSCTLVKIPASQLHDLIKAEEDVERAILAFILFNDNIIIERLRSCTHHKAEERVAHFLLEVFTRLKFQGLVSEQAYPLPITQEVIGELLGMTSVHVSRCMNALEQKKLIRKTRNSVNLLQIDQMVAMTGFDSRLIYGHVTREAGVSDLGASH